MDQNKEFSGKYRFVILGFLFPVFHYVIMLLVQLVATIVESFRLGVQFGDTLSEVELQEKLLTHLTHYSNLFSVISAVLTLLLALGVYWWISSRMRTRFMVPPTAKSYFSLHKITLQQAGKLMLLAFFFYHFVLGFLYLIGIVAPDLMESYNDAAQSLDTGTSAFSLVISFLALVIAAPITEELIYRNIAISNMRSRLPAVVSVFLSSIIFGLFHGNLIWMLYAGALGLVFGFLYVKSGSIYSSLAVHIVFNLLGFLYSALGQYVSGAILFSLIGISLVGAPLAFWWVWRDFSKKDMFALSNESEVL